MITLDSDIWEKLKGGYKVPYNASVPLRKLEQADNKEQIEAIFSELWNELHHQGDVDIASYLAIPQVVRICKAKQIFNWNLLGLCAVIEQQRHSKENPKLPAEYQEYYLQGLKDLDEYIVTNLKRNLDADDFRTALSALATCRGQIELGKAILELEGDVLTEFLVQF